MKLKNIFNFFYNRRKYDDYDLSNIKMGWQRDLPDPRDLKFKLTAPIALPPKVDLRSEMPPVYNQGKLGSCTGNAMGGAFQFEQIKQGKQDFIPSRLFIYYNTRELENNIKADTGATLRSTMKAMVDKGACPEDMWKYIPQKFTTKPPQNCYTVAMDNQVLKYFRVNHSLYHIKECLAEGYPVAFGIMLFQSFMSPETARTGKVVMPQRGERTFGGHAICCHPETTIITKDGMKNIEDVEVGDYVLTHTSQFKKVLKKFSREVEEDLIEINSNSGDKLLVTKEHPFLTKKYSIQTKLTQTLKCGQMEKDMKWEEAGNLCSGNLLYFPQYNEEHKFDNVIYEKEFFELIGMYMGDGNLNIRYSKNGNVKSARLRFSLNKNNPELIERCKNLISKYSNNKINEYWYENYVLITNYDTNLAKKIGELCGTARNKTLSWEILTAPKKMQRHIVIGWNNTDGCTSGKNFSIFTSEKNMMNELIFILRRLKIHYSIYKRKDGYSKIRGKKYKTKGGYNISVYNFNFKKINQKRTSHKTIYGENNLIKKVSNGIKNVSYKGIVYNLEVEDDNSYTANGISVHNCGVGFDDELESLIVRNSWGEKWGDKGYFYLPYSYITTPNLAADFWTIRLVE